MIKAFPTSAFMVREFHLAAEHPVRDQPTVIPDDELRLRLTLLGEEVAELVCATTGTDRDATEIYKQILVESFLVRMKYGDRSRVILGEIVKEAVDVHVVTSGLSIQYGLPEDEVYEVVHGSNMAKAGGPKRADGKSLKPEGWQPPDVHRVLYGDET